MAKRKTPKVKDLRPQKLNEEQTKEVQNIVSLANQIKLELGNMEARKHALLHELDGVNNQIVDMNKKLEEEYGKVDIDIATGNLQYLEDEQANS
tara:strand:- start:172 stop:453 length:282 start_codon:yes stop_codon:yes gene_type:complete